jgi:hypothetical protein
MNWQRNRGWPSCGFTLRPGPGAKRGIGCGGIVEASVYDQLR